MKKLTIYSLFITILGCKTSSRDEVGIAMTDISLKLPSELASYESKVSFSRIDSSAKPKVVKGTDVKVKLPTGTYTIDLALTDKSGNELFRSCQNSKTYSFNGPKQDAIIDICKTSDNSLVGKTIATIDIVKIPAVIENPPTIEENQVPNKNQVEEQKKIDENKEKKAEDIPLFIEDRTCFGLNASYQREGNEVVIKMSGSIKEHLFDSTNAPKCTLLLNVTKEHGQGFAPILFRLKYSADPETMRQNYYISSLVRDENGLQALPCRSMLMNSESNSGAPYQCSFYDTTPEKFLNVTERNKPLYANSCAAKSQQIRFDFFLNGTVDKLLKEMTISELRVQIPFPERCITPSN